MRAYTDFAGVYDTFMDQTPYREWCDFLAGQLREEGIREGLVLDLGCGTGTLTALLSEAGYDMIGVDNSPEMLQTALEKQGGDGSILYLLQDMREFELYGTVAAAVSVCDSLNYLLEEEDLRKTFRLVNNYLDPGGIFLFDFNTVYKYETVIGDTVIAENRDECSFIWENYYDHQTEINEYELTVFVQEREELYRRFTETHFQRGYRPEQLRRLAEEAGLQFLHMLDGDTHGPVTEKSERVFMAVKERMK